MRRIGILKPVLLTAVLLSCGCSSNNKGKIEGTKWVNAAATVKGQPVPAGLITFEFKKDGGLTYDIIGQVYTGTYSLGGGDNVTLNLDKELSGSKKHVQKVTISGDKLTITDSDGTAMTFTKVTEPAKTGS